MNTFDTGLRFNRQVLDLEYVLFQECNIAPGSTSETCSVDNKL